MATTVSRFALSLREVAEATGLGTTTLRRVVQRGELPTVRVGRRRLVRVEDVEAWLAKRSR
jgi:excisionase family DNA binding protein